jgi:hypothetical protein
MGDGLVLKTSDGGTTWNQQWTGTAKGVEGISFPDLNTGYICGWSAYFAKTTNGGTTWTTQLPGTNVWYYTDVVFKNAPMALLLPGKMTGTQSTIPTMVESSGCRAQVSQNLRTGYVM